MCIELDTIYMKEERFQRVYDYNSLDSYILYVEIPTYKNRRKKLIFNSILFLDFHCFTYIDYKFSRLLTYDLETHVNTRRSQMRVSTGSRLPTVFTQKEKPNQTRWVFKPYLNATTTVVKHNWTHLCGK